MQRREGAIVREHLPVGRHGASLTVSDGACTSTDSTTVAVVDTTPPVVSAAGAPDLWPPNHKLQTVSLADCGITVQDACEGPLRAATAAITCVTSDEPPDQKGDGNTSADIEIVDRSTVRLRAERQGAGDGRLYKIHFRVQDRAGNEATGVCAVRVPHDASGTPAADSGEAYRVCSR